MCYLCVRKPLREMRGGHTRRLSQPQPRRLTVGAQQALKLGEQPDGVELPQEAVVVQAVPQLDDEATDERGQLQGTDTASPRAWPTPVPAPALLCLRRPLALGAWDQECRGHGRARFQRSVCFWFSFRPDLGVTPGPEPSGSPELFPHGERKGLYAHRSRSAPAGKRGAHDEGQEWRTGPSASLLGKGVPCTPPASRAQEAAQNPPSLCHRSLC